MANLKVRVRAATGGPTLKVQVPPPCSLQALKDVIASQIGQPTSSFQISLNKKAPIDGPPNVLLSAFGIINGDLLFYIPTARDSVHLSTNVAPPVLGNVTPSSTPTSVSSGDDHLESPRDIAVATRGEGQGSTGGGKSVDPASLCRELCAAAALQRAKISQPLESSPRSNASPSEASNNSNSSSSRDSAAGSHVVEPVKQNLKGKDKVQDKIQDTMDASISGSGAMEVEMEENESCPPGSPNPPRTHSSLPDILHRVLLVEYEKVKEQQAILVLAIHAVMLETGFVLKQPMGVVGSSAGCGLPASWSGRGNLVNLSYTLPEIIQASSLGLQPHSVGHVLLRCQVVGNALVIYGCMPEANGSDIYRLSLPVSQHLHKDLVVEDKSTAGLAPEVDLFYHLPICSTCNCMTNQTEQIEGGQATRLQYFVVMADIGVHGKQDATPMDCQATKKHPTHDNTMNMFCNVFELWKQIKDNISLPLLTCMCEKAGLPPPASLLLLPTELKIKILEYLPAISLAIIGCVCSELKFLSSTDDLWKTRFKETFGWPDSGRAPPGGRGWKTAFIRESTRRARREEERREAERQLRADVFPALLMRPSPMNPYFPGMLGGDYDRFPAFGGGPGARPRGGPGEFWSAGLPAGGLGEPDRLMLPNPGGGSRSCELGPNMRLTHHLSSWI